MVLAGRGEADIGITTIKAALGIGDVDLCKRLLRANDGNAAAHVAHKISSRVARDEVARVLADTISAGKGQPIGDVTGVSRDPVEATRLDELGPLDCADGSAGEGGVGREVIIRHRIGRPGVEDGELGVLGRIDVSVDLAAPEGIVRLGSREGAGIRSHTAGARRCFERVPLRLDQAVDEQVIGDDRATAFEGQLLPVGLGHAAD